MHLLCSVCHLYRSALFIATVYDMKRTVTQLIRIGIYNGTVWAIVRQIHGIYVIYTYSGDVIENKDIRTPDTQQSDLEVHGTRQTNVAGGSAHKHLIVTGHHSPDTGGDVPHREIARAECQANGSTLSRSQQCFGKVA